MLLVALITLEGSKPVLMFFALGIDILALITLEGSKHTA